ncbi:MAG: hypothetical protein ABI456_15950 [Ktedonobacteraceae bacterium]
MRKIEDKRHYKRRYWLLIASGTGALMPLVLALFVALGHTLGYMQGNYSLGKNLLDWRTVLGGAIFAIGPMLSMAICWLFIVNTARRVTWYRGLVAALVASVLAYPLTSVVLVVSLLISLQSWDKPGILGPGLLLLAPFASFLLFPSLGVYTTIIGVLLGSLLGWLQGLDEAQLQRSPEASVSSESQGKIRAIL